MDLRSPWLLTTYIRPGIPSSNYTSYLKLFSLTSLLPQGLQARCEDGSGAIHWLSSGYPGFRPPKKNGGYVLPEISGERRKKRGLFLRSAGEVGCWLLVRLTPKS